MYSEIKLNIKDSIIKTKNNNEIIIRNKLIFKRIYNGQHDNNCTYIYFINNKAINYKEKEINPIEKIIIYDKIFYRINEEYPEGCLLDTYGNHLYLTLYFNDIYTYLEPIKRKKEFLKELSIIINQKLEWKIQPLLTEYDNTNYDELLENEDIRIKFVFYCMEFILNIICILFNTN